MTEKVLRLGGDDAGRFTWAARVGFVAALALYAGVRLWRLDASCLWFDEIFGIHAALHEWGGLLRFVAADIIHPPFFYAVLKAWVWAGGESLLWLRLLPALLSILTVVPLVLLARELRLGAWETNLALLLMAANGYLIKYAQEVRMYSLLLLLTVASLWLFARFVNAGARRTLAALTLVNLLLVYTHYYGWLVVAAELLFVAGRSQTVRRARLKPFLFSALVLAAAYAPWGYALLRAREAQGRGVEQNLGWVERPAPADVARFQALLHEPFYFQQSSAEPLYTKFTAPAGFLIFGLPLLLLLLRADARREGDSEDSDEAVGDEGDDGRRGDGRGWLWWALCFVLAPVLLAFGLSRLLPQSVWGTRHLIVVAASYMLLAAAAFARARPVWLRVALLVALGCWLAWGAAVVASRREGAFIWCAWEGHAARVREATAAADSATTEVYTFEDLVAYHLWFALGAGRNASTRVTVVKNVPGLEEDRAYFLPRAFDGVRAGGPDLLAGEQFWVAFRDTALTDKRPPLKLLRERGYRVEQVYETSAQGQTAYLVHVRKVDGR